MLAVGLIARVVSSGRARVPLAALAAICALGAVSPPPADASELPPVIQTVPEVPGMRFVVNGIPFKADGSGRAYPPQALVGSRARPRALETDIAPGVRARFDRWYRHGGIAAVNLDYRVDIGFVDLEGNRVDRDVVSRGDPRGQQRAASVLCRRHPAMAPGQPCRAGERRAAVHRVVLLGGGGARGGLDGRAPWAAALLPCQGPKGAAAAPALLGSLRRARRAARVPDRLSGPAGVSKRPRAAARTRARGRPDVRSLPRGDYRVSVDALGISSSRPVALSGDQKVDLFVISWLDVAVVLLGLASLALASALPAPAQAHRDGRLRARPRALPCP